MTDTRNTTVILTACLVYLLFVIYGSLVPLDFRPQSLSEAWHSFLAIRYLDLGIGSRADWVANILLFIPLSFLLLGVFWPRQGIALRVLVTVIVWMLCLILSVSIEFTQLFFPPRTVSQNDILAESIGAIFGTILWWWQGDAIVARISHWRSIRGRANIALRLLWLYLVLMFGYNLLPLDLTISPVEIYHKWHNGKIILLPFGFHVENRAQFAYNLLTDVALWIPVSFLWILSDKKSRRQAWIWTVATATILEGLQLLVYSRVSDITDILTSMIGAGIGVWLSRYWRAKNPETERADGHTAQWLGMAGVLAWLVVLAVVFWYPFNFNLDRTFLRLRLDMFDRVPFYSYYYGTEFRAVTEVLHKVLFFAPLGILLALMGLPIRSQSFRRLFSVFSVAAILMTAVIIELGQVALPDKSPDSTDIVLETLGGFAGFLGLAWIRSRREDGHPTGSPRP
jgi:glycopeptide antibiotics resistance protein